MVAGLQELSPISKKLNAASNNINNTIKKINEKLRNLNIGLEIFLESPMYTSDVDQVGRARQWLDSYLGYCFVEEAWQLAVKNVTKQETWEEDNERTVIETLDVSYEPLLKAGRQRRIDALGSLSPLFDAIKFRMETILRDIEAAEAAADAL